MCIFSAFLSKAVPCCTFSISSALVLAFVGVLSMAVGYALYYYYNQCDLGSCNEDGGGMMGGGGGGGPGNSGSGGGEQPPSPPPPARWRPTTLWGYFLIKLCVPVFGALLSIALLTITARWLKSGILQVRQKTFPSFPLCFH